MCYNRALGLKKTSGPCSGGCSFSRAGVTSRVSRGEFSMETRKGFSFSKKKKKKSFTSGAYTITDYWVLLLFLLFWFYNHAPHSVKRQQPHSSSLFHLKKIAVPFRSLVCPTSLSTPSLFWYPPPSPPPIFIFCTDFLKIDLTAPR